MDGAYHAVEEQRWWKDGEDPGGHDFEVGIRRPEVDLWQLRAAVKPERGRS